ncbi:arylformamidase [Zobellella endophytica]|uniref:Kynurenine formamidase n=1 Tax=Zobellella endophytica TaxID=2116700 RepID=A0A2P7R840_9GAMM|nr:arylformamidase [Zobellella endophytica]PSJ46398.1 arylformamidase [Zobellella endophytica]
MSRIWDISQTLRAGIPVWPGDTPYGAEPSWVMENGCPVNVARLSLSTHTGTHADAPLHYHAEGQAMAEVALEAYIGPCLVLDVTHARGRVEPGDLPAGLPARLERVLLKTCGRFPHEQWRADFTAVAAATIDLLAERGTRLIGVDSPSLDPQDAKTLDAHQRVWRHRMAILEGLVLDDIEPGHYELIAPPLKLAHLDASPVRALLRSIDT